MLCDLEAIGIFKSESCDVDGILVDALHYGM